MEINKDKLPTCHVPKTLISHDNSTNPVSKCHPIPKYHVTDNKKKKEIETTLRHESRPLNGGHFPKAPELQLEDLGLRSSFSKIGPRRPFLYKSKLQPLVARARIRKSR